VYHICVYVYEVIQCVVPREAGLAVSDFLGSDVNRLKSCVMEYK
jgi:hypothetical protein